ncbi:MAG: hypothetical protein RLZZ252_1285 [Bacteroidota bacterium]|jgi:lipoate-protein ligase A
MRLIELNSLDVYYNLAAEAFFLHETEKSLLILWRSEKAVVCGKHQNICAEINVDYCRRNGIAPARRISGGGTVFHDMGNVNFTFIQPIGDSLDKAVDYKQFLEPVRTVLQGMGIETNYSVRHDLLFGSDKISGNAQHIFQQGKRVLHHGTLLFNANLNALGGTLHPTGTYIDKAVKSNRSNVTNLGDHFPKYLDMDCVLSDLKAGFEVIYGTKFEGLFDDEHERIDQLRISKFALDSWIFGYSPSFSVTKQISTPDLGDILWMWRIQKGIVESVVVQRQQTQELVLEKECSMMVGKPYYGEEIRTILSLYSLAEDKYYYQLF